MSDFKPGTVAIATVQGAPNVRVMRLGKGTEFGWVSGHQFNCLFYHLDREVTDVRPLVVLDLEGIYTDGEDGDALDFVRTLRQLAHADGNPYRSKIAHAIADQIEAQTKPARIPEPGLWGVVSATVQFEGTTYKSFLTHHPGGGGAKCWQDASGNWFFWSELIDPVLIREGLS